MLNISASSRIYNLSASEPLIKYEYMHGMNQLREDAEGRFTIWEQPKRGVPYVISADIAAAAPIIIPIIGK